MSTDVKRASRVTLAAGTVKNLFLSATFSGNSDKIS